MNIYARQGDLVIEAQTKTDGDWTRTRDIVFAGDSSGHRHRLVGECMIVRINAQRTRVRVDQPAELVHEKSDGHGSVTLEPGVYEVRRLRERGDGADRAVED